MVFCRKSDIFLAWTVSSHSSAGSVDRNDLRNSRAGWNPGQEWHFLKRISIVHSMDSRKRSACLPALVCLHVAGPLVFLDWSWSEVTRKEKNKAEVILWTDDEKVVVMGETTETKEKDKDMVWDYIRTGVNKASGGCAFVRCWISTLERTQIRPTEGQENPWEKSGQK